MDTSPASQIPSKVTLLWPRKYEEIPQEDLTMANADRARIVDAENEKRRKINEHTFKTINAILQYMGLAQIKVPTHMSYVETIKRTYEIWLQDPYQHNIDAIRYLARKNKFAEKDYVIEQAFDIANRIEAAIHKKRIKQEHNQRIPLELEEKSEAHLSCSDNCRATWDGVGQTCFCGNLNAQWIVEKDHSFLRPHVTPFGQ